MKTISDLGRETKQKHQGKYDHLSDTEVGRRMKNKNPSKYAEYEDIAISTEETNHFDYLVSELDQLSGVYRSDRGRITSWWQRGKAESRTKLLAALNGEMEQIIQAINLRAAAHGRAWFHKAEMEMAKLLHNNQKAILEIATVLGMTAETYQRKLLMQMEVDKETLLMQEQSRIRLEEARELAKIEAEKQHFIKLSGADVDSKMIMLDKIYDAQKAYYALVAAKAPKKEIEAAKAHLDDLEEKREKGWESIIKR